MNEIEKAPTHRELQVLLRRGRYTIANLNTLRKKHKPLTTNC
jgi:hypothetical protein